MERIISTVEFLNSCRAAGLNPLWTRQAKRWIVRIENGNGFIMAIPYGRFHVAVTKTIIDLH